MHFILNLTIREIRAWWRRFLFFFLCIAIGVGSIVALRSIIHNLSNSVGGDARELLTADFVITSANEFTPTELATIESVVSQAAIVNARNETIEVSVLARPAESSNQQLKFVALKGIQPSFPLVGDFRISGGQALDFKLLENRGAVVAGIVLDELNVKVGDKIRIGEADLEIRATFDEEPGSAGGLQFGSRVFTSIKAFDEMGLTRNTGRIRRSILYRTSDNPTKLVEQLREALRGTTVTIRSYRETQENLDAQFRRTEDYLSLTGLLILVLGGVGVWNVSRSFVEQKRKSIAVLKCLGASGTRVIAVYTLQIFVLGLIGSIAGVLLAQAAMLLIKYYLAGDLPRTMSYLVQFPAALQGVALGISISLLFSALPLLQIRNIKPNLLLRDETGEKLRRLDPVKWSFGILFLIGLISLAVWQAGSVKVGAFFIAGLGATSAVLYFSAFLLTRILRYGRGGRSFAFAQAVNSLYRPGNQTRVILMAVGLGTFVVLAVQSVERNLVREFDFTARENAPSLFFIDVQGSQIEGLRQTLEQLSGETPESIPTVRARISGVNGEPIDFQDREIRQQQGQIGREFAITYRAGLEENESIRGGEWWRSDQAGTGPEVSVLDDFAERLKIGVGDTITFDISGRKITATVTNIRRIDFRNVRTAFIFVFRPGTLEKAPQSYLATIMKRIPEAERARLKFAVLDKFPNVQIFDVMEIAVVVQKLIGNFVLAISFVGTFIIFSGILILIGSVALTKSQRIYENAVLKTLGAKRRTLAAILFAEYGILGILAGIIGTGSALLLSYVVSKYVFEIDWEFNWPLSLSGVLITAVLVMTVGAAASFDVLFKKPLSTLRSQ